MALRILLLEDSEDDALLLLHKLKKSGYETISERVDTREDFEAALENKTWDVITADYAMPYFDGLSALDSLKKKMLDIPFIIVSGKIGEELAVEAMRRGASDYILKNNLKRLVPTIEREIREAENRRQKREAEKELELEQERLDVTLASIGDAVIATDIKGNIILLNLVAENLTGWTQEEAIGRSLFEVFNIISEETRLPAEDPVRKAIKTGLVVGLANHTILITRDGMEIHVADSCAPIRSKDGSTIGAVLVFKDVTKDRKAYELSKALNDINSAISSTLDFDEIMQKVVVEAAKAIGSEAASINLREGDRWVPRFVYRLPPELAAQSYTDEQFKSSMIAARTKQPVIVNDALNDERINQEVARQFHYRSLMVLPLKIKDQIIGTLKFYYISSQVSFTEAEIDFADKLSVSVSLAIENANLYEVERTIADTLQSAFLTMPEAIDGIDFGHLYCSATDTAKVGGDFYDIFAIEDGKIGIAIGDVAGKGLHAAALTSTVKNAIRVYAYEGISPSEVMEKTNRLLVRMGSPSSFVTAFFGILDTRKEKLTYCSAGHPPAMIRRDPLYVVECLNNHSPVIGAFQNIHYEEVSVPIEKGDTLVLYTDGVTEARCNGGFYGEERLIELIKSMDQTSAKEMPQAIFSNILNSFGNLADDVAILTISLNGGPGGVPLNIDF